MEQLSKRTRAAGLSMLLGGAALMVPPLLGPPNGADDTKQRLTDLAANPGPTVAKSLVFQLGVLLLLPGVVAIIGRTRGRGSGAVVSGGIVYGAGLVGAFTFMVMSGVEVALAGDGPINSTLVQAADRMGSSPAAIPGFVLALLMFHLIGLPWLTFGMVRARQIPWWLALLATAATFSAFFGSGTALEAVGWETTGIALGLIALTLMRPRWPLATSAAAAAQVA